MPGVGKSMRKGGKPGVNSRPIEQSLSEHSLCVGKQSDLRRKDRLEPEFERP